ncbi:MAG: glycosyltransferase [bacterium]|nr:glycosyltransferase [bacterium]
MSVRLASPARPRASLLPLRVGLLRSSQPSHLSLALDNVLRTSLRNHGCHLSLVATHGAHRRRALWSVDAVIAQVDCARDLQSRDSTVVGTVSAIPAPAIVVLHSIASRPSPTEVYAVAELCAWASLVVVMSQAANTALLCSYPVDADKVIVIPWGANSSRALSGPLRTADEPEYHVLTWGDIVPGLGAEHVIDALAHLYSTGQAVRYTVASTAHQDLRIGHTAAYARHLRQRAQEAGIGHLVKVTTGSRDSTALRRLVASTSLVVLPTDDDTDLVSPNLVASIAAGRPVIATRFPHAAELLGDGAGLLVPHRNPAALAEAIRVTTTDRCILNAMSRRARLLAPSLSWACAERRFVEACMRVSGSREMLAA